MKPLPAWKPGTRLTHRHRGACVYTDVCAALQALNADPTSVFVDFGDGPMEVTAVLVREEGEA